MAGRDPLLSGTLFAQIGATLACTRAWHRFYSVETFANDPTTAGTDTMRRYATLFEQTVQHFCWDRFDRLVRQHGADEDQRGFTSRKHFLALLAAALGGHQGLRPLIVALAPNSAALQQLGGEEPARSTLSDAMRDRPADLFFDLLQELLCYGAYRKERRALREAVRLIDATHLGFGKRKRRWDIELFFK